MSNLTFRVAGVAPVLSAAVPMLGFQLEVNNAVLGGENELIHSVAMRCQLQLEVTRRNYTPAEKENLADLFGEPGRWGQTLRPLLWTHVQTVLPPFRGNITVELLVPCTFDFNVAATKYFYGLEDGEIPVCLMFSGTVFQADGNGMLQVAPIAWDKEARFRIPMRAWREMMDSYYPNTAWLSLRRDLFDRVHRYKIQNGIPTWEQALERLLEEQFPARGKAVPV